MTVLGYAFDCSFRLDADQADEAVRAGYVAAIRYLYPDPDAPKTIVKREADVIRAAGLALGLVWETTAGRALDGYQAGRDDARAAMNLAAGLGAAAAGAGIYFACDTDANWSDAEPYYRGVHESPPWTDLRAGAYGGVPVVLGAADAGYTSLSWIGAASSWNHGMADPGADLWQRVGAAPGLSFDADQNAILSRDPGFAGLTPAPPAPPISEGVEMLTFAYGGHDFVMWCSAGKLLYRGLAAGDLAKIVTLSTDADPTNPLLVKVDSIAGPIIYGAATGGRTMRARVTATLPDGTPLFSAGVVA